jgi:hypothetical protein
MTVPMLARIDGTSQLKPEVVAEKLKSTVSNLNQKIAKY